MEGPLLSRGRGVELLQAVGVVLIAASFFLFWLGELAAGWWSLGIGFVSVSIGASRDFMKAKRELEGPFYITVQRLRTLKELNVPNDIMLGLSDLMLADVQYPSIDALRAALDEHLGSSRAQLLTDDLLQHLCGRKPTPATDVVMHPDMSHPMLQVSSERSGDGMRESRGDRTTQEPPSARENQDTV